MKKTLLFFLLLTPGLTLAKGLPARWTARYTMTQTEDGKPSTHFHVTQMSCNQKSCSTIIVSMNNCLAGMFYPSIEHYSVEKKTMSIKNTEGDKYAIELQVHGLPMQLTMDLACKGQVMGDYCLVRVSDLKGTYSGPLGGKLSPSPTICFVLPWPETN